MVPDAGTQPRLSVTTSSFLQGAVTESLGRCEVGRQNRGY